MVAINVEHLNEIGVELLQEAGLGPEMTTRVSAAVVVRWPAALRTSDLSLFTH